MNCSAFAVLVLGLLTHQASCLKSEEKVLLRGLEGLRLPSLTANLPEIAWLVCFSPEMNAKLVRNPLEFLPATACTADQFSVCQGQLDFTEKEKLCEPVYWAFNVMEAINCFHTAKRSRRLSTGHTSW